MRYSKRHRKVVISLIVALVLSNSLLGTIVSATEDLPTGTDDSVKTKYTNGSGDAVDWALTNLGMNEGTSEHAAVIDEYNAYLEAHPDTTCGYTCGHDDAWCCAYVGWSYVKAGYADDVAYKGWECTDWMKKMDERGAQHYELGQSYTPTRDNIWICEHHIEQVIEGIDAETAITIGGNSSDKVKVNRSSYDSRGTTTYWYCPNVSGGNATTQQSPTMEQAGASGVADYFAKTEWELEGMGGAGLKREFDDFNIDLPTKDSLSADTQQWVQQFGEIITSERATRVINIVRAVIATIALWLVFYAVFLYFAYWLDRLNNYYELRLLNTLTLGRLEVSPDDKTSTFHKHGVSGERVVVHKDMLCLVVIIVTVSMLILSGKAYDMLHSLINFLQSVFDAWF